ncbi:MAG: patatin-like phospholipase family protein [Lachnospiraceae bacterium]|nr:patatin-like phospholipase family protein [Lachnospiraceae bacterium]
MELKLDTSKEYGLVLEGGGARGAYQIGAWRALREAGVKIKGVSGTSVGALNGALVCMGDLEKAEEVWENISYSQVMSVEDEFMERIMSRDFKNLNHVELITNVLLYLSEGGIDVTPLRELIDTHIDEDRIRFGDIEFFFQVFSATELKELEIEARELPDGELADMVLASAYFPVFKKEKIKGDRLIDGGMFNNVPIDSLVKRGYTDIISIRIYGIGLEKPIRLPEEARVTEIAPRVELGNILEFDSKKSRRNMKIGYYDAMRVLYGLGGTIYYIDTRLGERECLLRFLKAGMPPYRDFLEEDLPMLAGELGLSRGWDYQDLYLAVLEASAKLVRVQKYKIYTEDELLAEIKSKWERMDAERREELPEFVEYILQTQE